jgi:hypothetical protein
MPVFDGTNSNQREKTQLKRLPVQIYLHQQFCSSADKPHSIITP